MKKQVCSCLAAAILLCVSAESAIAAPAIWKASDDDSEVWLFGSVHLLTEDTQWKTPTLNNAVESAEVFYYETPTDQQAQVKVATLIGRYGLNLDGRKLTDYLTPEQTKLLKEVTAGLGMPMARLQPMKPWLAGLTLQIMFLQKSGYQPNAGVEMSMDPLTPEEQERFFETVEEQIGFFTGLSEEVAVGALMASLRQIQDQPRLFDKLIAAWEAGDLATLNALFNDTMKDAGPEVYEALITNRNEAWVDEILALMEGDTDALVIVGAGHMVGEQGVPALLEAEGVVVERVQ